MQAQTKLMNKNFILLWQGQAVSQIGTQAFAVAIAFWIKHATDSATLMGLLQMMAGLPAVLLGPIGGTFADRNSRRTIIIVSDAINGLAILILTGFIFLSPHSTNVILVCIFIVAVTLSVVNSFFQPAIAAAVPDLVPSGKITVANSLSQATAQLSVLVGLGVGGVLLRVLGAPILFLVNGLSYLFSAACELFITIPQELPEKSGHWREQFQSFKRDTLTGVRFIRGNPGLTKLILAATFLNFFNVPIILLLPFYVEDFLHVQADWFGFLAAGFGVGALFGYALAGSVKLSGRTRSIVMIAFLVLQSVGYTLLSIWIYPYAALAIAVFCGAVSGFVMVNLTTILQLTTPSEVRGRVFGLMSTFAGCITPIGAGLAGIVADLLNRNVPLMYFGCGVIMVVGTLLFSLSRDFRKYLAYEIPAGLSEGASGGPEKIENQAEMVAIVHENLTDTKSKRKKRTKNERRKDKKSRFIKTTGAS